MSFAKIDMKQELRRVAQHKPTSVPVAVLAALVLDAWNGTPEVPSGKRGDSLQFLERLYALRDPR